MFVVCDIDGQPMAYGLYDGAWGLWDDFTNTSPVTFEPAIISGRAEAFVAFVRSSGALVSIGRLDTPRDVRRGDICVFRPGDLRMTVEPTEPPAGWLRALPRHVP